MWVNNEPCNWIWCYLSWVDLSPAVQGVNIFLEYCSKIQTNPTEIWKKGVLRCGLDGVCRLSLKIPTHYRGPFWQRSTHFYGFFSQCRHILNKFWVFAWRTLGNFWKTDPCSGIFLMEPMFMDFLRKSNPLEWHFPICLNMWVPPGLRSHKCFSYSTFRIENLKFDKTFSIQRGVSRTTGPILGLFVLKWMHFHAESKYSNESLNVDNFWKSFENVWGKCWPVICHSAGQITCIEMPWSGNNLA